MRNRLPNFLILSLIICLNASAQQKQLTVITSLPMGRTESIADSRQISVTFGEPMTALQARPTDMANGPLTIRPSIPGAYRWMGTGTLAFIPVKQLPYATSFTARIPAGTAALSGNRLTSAIEWSFETPRPKVVWTSPPANGARVDPATSIVIRFNQPVEASSASRYISIALRSSPGWVTIYPAYSARNATAADSVGDTLGTLILKPVAPLGMDAVVTVDVKAGLTGREGPLPADVPYSLKFSTYAGLRFLGRDESNGPPTPQSGITLRFTNPVTPADVMSHLDFVPALATRGEYYENTYPTENVYIPLPLKADSSYTATLHRGLKDRFGNILQSDSQFMFTVRSYPPFVRTRTGIGVLEGYEQHKFPITTMNVDSVRLQCGVVNPDSIVPLMERMTWDYYSKIAIREGALLTPSSNREATLEYARWKVIRPKGIPNTVTVRPLDLDDVLGSNGRGVVFVQVDDLNSRRQGYLKALVQVTDFGITGKFSPVSNLIWVTNLRDASPVPSASVEIRNDSNRIVWRGTTDAKGLVRTPGWGKLAMASGTANPGTGEDEGDEGDGEDYYESGGHIRQWVIVRKGNDIAFTSSDWNDGIQPYRFDIRYEWNPKPEVYEGQLVTDRGLYKAGEAVFLKGICRLRADDMWKIPSGFRSRLVVRNPRGEEILNREEHCSAFGSFADTVRLKPAAPAGEYDLRWEYQTIRNGRQVWRGLGWNSFRVEAFRAAEFSVTARFDTNQYILGDSLRGFINARYLFGGAMKNERIRWRLTVSRTQYSPPGYDSWYFGPLEWLAQYQYGFRSRELQNKDTMLDAFGTTQIRAMLKTGELEGTLSVMLEGDVTSPSRQELSGRTTATVHGGEYYIGIKPASSFVSSGKPLDIRFVTPTSGGTPTKGHELTCRIFQRVWHSVRKAETGGRYAWFSVPADSLLDSSRVVIADTQVVRKFTPPSPGFYYIEATGTDNRGNKLKSQAYWYATGSGYVPWERTNSDRIDLIANASSFRPGDTARIIVKNPYEKTVALVTIEREGILRHFTTMLAGSAPEIDIPIRHEDLPNIFVSVVLLQGRTGKPSSREEADVGRPSFKVGYVGLSVNPKEMKLAVTAEPDRHTYRPGDTVSVTLRVKSQAGKAVRAEVALSVADLGVLNLIGYRLPDPFDAFYHERGLAVVTTETRMHIIEQRSYDEKGQEAGGGGAESPDNIPDAEGVRKDFRPSACWNPSILTDEKGTAIIRFKLPDNLTSFAIMAIAQTRESEFGYGENFIVVNKPLLLQPSLPRFARVGDAFNSGVVVMNYSDSTETIRLTTSVKGLSWDHRDTTVHTLQPGQAKEVLFRFTAEKTGTATLVFRANSRRNSDGLRWTIPVQLPRIPEVVATTGSTTDSTVVEMVRPPVDVVPDAGGMDVTAASTAMVGLSGGISYLFHYPYGCLEQRSSAVLPMILAKDLVEAFKFDVLKNADYTSVVMKTIDEIPLFQHTSGGFSYWKNDEYVWPYVSAYAMYTLVQAKNHGYRIDEASFGKGLGYLRRVLTGEEKDRYSYPSADRCTRALIVYTLALAGKPEFGYMENLFNQRKDLPLFAKAYLLKALHASNGNTSMRDELVRELSNLARISPASAHFEENSASDLWWCFDSNVRSTALIMQALTETQPENPLIPKVMRWLVDQQKAGCWRTTQENFYVVDALATYLRVYEKAEPDLRAVIRLGAGEIIDHLFRGRTFDVASASVPMNSLKPGEQVPVDITRTGQGRLYYGVRMTYYPLGESRQKDEGLSLVKTMQDTGGRTADTLKPGALIKVTLTVSSTQDRHFIVVDDPIPAGTEIVNSAFVTTSAAVPEEAEADDGSWAPLVFDHVERYDDRIALFADYFSAGSHSYSYTVRVTRPGIYRMPATRAEGMYEPEVFGQTASSTVVVR